MEVYGEYNALWFVFALELVFALETARNTREHNRAPETPRERREP